MKLNRQAELAKQLTGKELLLSVYLTQVILLILAVILSFVVYRSIPSFFSLFRWDPKWLFVATICGVLVVSVDVLLMKLLPSHYYSDGGINEKLFSNLSIFQITILVLVIAIVEEWLFRGVVQVKLGLIPSCIIFALVHFRYWAHWYLIINVVVLSFLFGIVFELSGQQLLPVILMHFIIDFLLGLYIKRSSQIPSLKERDRNV